MTRDTIRLTRYSHGAGCGCKIAPDVLSRILGDSLTGADPTLFPGLLIGNHSRDDAAAFDIGDGRAVLSTTDFFMPIVDDPYDFGRIAATNALSDIYAMGGTPLMAIAILGWPIEKLAPEVASRVIAGGRAVCAAANIPLAGGHSIDAPEPIFGLAATGIVATAHLKANSTAQCGDQLFLTKPLGIGILTTAEKQGKVQADHAKIAVDTMCQLNDVGSLLGTLECVHALTDVTGFALAGHLLVMCEAANLNACIDESRLPLLPGLRDYIAQGCIPGGCSRNFQAYGDQLPTMTPEQQTILCDPQTSGGLLIAVAPEHSELVRQLLADRGLPASIIGELESPDDTAQRIRFGH